MNKDLKHFGILGMHWGIRRKNPSHPDASEAHTLKKKPIHELSNAEIQKINKRLQLEQQLKQLKAADSARGQSFVARLLSGKFAKGIATEIFRQYVAPNFSEAFTPRGDATPKKKRPGSSSASSMVIDAVARDV